MDLTTGYICMPCLLFKDSNKPLLKSKGDMIHQIFHSCAHIANDINLYILKFMLKWAPQLLKKRNRNNECQKLLTKKFILHRGQENVLV